MSEKEFAESIKKLIIEYNEPFIAYIILDDIAKMESIDELSMIFSKFHNDGIKEYNVRVSELIEVSGKKPLILTESIMRCINIPAALHYHLIEKSSKPPVAVRIDIYNYNQNYLEESDYQEKFYIGSWMLL